MQPSWLKRGALALPMAGGLAVALALLLPANRREKASRSHEETRNLEVFVTEVPADRRIPIVFQVVNPGNRPLRVLDVQRSCTILPTHLASEDNCTKCDYLCCANGVYYKSEMDCTMNEMPQCSGVYWAVSACPL